MPEHADGIAHPERMPTTQLYNTRAEEVSIHEIARIVI
jgi:hypothetical protein